MPGPGEPLGGGRGIHAAVVPEHLTEATLYGVLFLALAVAQLAFADALFRSPTPALLTASVGLNAVVTLMWLASRTTGLPLGPHPFHRQAVGLLDVLCSAAQVALAAGCLWLLRSEPAATRRLAGGQAT